MARSLTAASSHYLESSSTPVLATEPVTIAAWVNPNDVTGSYVALAYGTGVTSRVQLLLDGANSGDLVRAQAVNSAGTVGSAATSAGYVANAWQHICGVFSATNARLAYLNGGNSGSNSTSAAMSTPDRIVVGARYSASTRGLFMDGLIAEVAGWGVALTAAEVAVLATGVCPLLVRPSGLLFYAPLVGQTSPEIEKYAGTSLTVTGAVAAAHAPVRYPHRRGSPYYTPAVVASSLIPIVGDGAAWGGAYSWME